MNSEEDITPRRLFKGQRKHAGPQCPAPTELASLAAGLLPPDRSEELLDHAAMCDDCASLLRHAVEDFTDEETDEEVSAVAALPTAEAAGRRKLAKMMADQSRRPFFENVKWMGRAAAVVIMVAGSWFAWNQWRTPQPEQLIAVAYTEHRGFEFRVHGASYAELRAQRGVGSPLERPEALIAAEARIAGELKKQPDDPRWLRMRGLAELLNHDPEAAVETLRRAVDQRPDDPRLLADLGIAYALRAEAANRASDYPQAIEYLGRAGKAAPNDTTILFNRALVYERMFLYELAAEDWQRLLTLESGEGWAGEARQRLRDIEQKKKIDRKP
jgi:tetratricopeptide (TPR) repeat protein